MFIIKLRFNATFKNREGFNITFKNREKFEATLEDREGFEITFKDREVINIDENFRKESFEKCQKIRFKSYIHSVCVRCIKEFINTNDLQ